mgnify:CR=1 FL=1
MTASVAIDFGSPAVRPDPHPTYRRLREESPVVWNDVTRSWVVSRYDDVAGLFTDPRMSSARTEAIFSTLPEEVRPEMEPLRRVLGSRMLLTDPPEHTRLKSLVMKAFSAKTTETRREHIRALCDRFLDRAAERGDLDVVADLAQPLPSWVIADLLGVPADDQPRFTRWSHDQVRVYDRPGTIGERVAVMRQGQASMLEMRGYLEAVIDERRREPREDLISELVAAEEAGDRLSTEELVVMVVALLVGGNNSTAHLIANAALTLLRRPDVVARLREEPGLARTTIEEVLRWESPVQATSRVVRDEPVALGGQEMQVGDSVHLLIGSANRDPSQFPDPDDFAPARRPNRHLTFGGGPHFCLGSSTARAIAQTAVLALVERFPEARLATDEVCWQESFSFRSVVALPVVLRPASNVAGVVR